MFKVKCELLDKGVEMKKVSAILVLTIFLASCGISEANVQATISALPTWTSAPTATPADTQTPHLVVVTATHTATPKFTATSSFTPTITYTPSLTPNVEQTNEAKLEATQTARLTANRGSGFFLVGVDIAAGTWRSEAGYSACYWSRNNATGGINDNHFGNSGGTVHIRASDYEVEFNGCGQWTYLGP
ncbi:MAG: hypothetical protein KIT08_01530 [Anaerolineales bacterium]|nr:MAG: hypothetical protein KIT08_01530 [Anaerolineales bacterium]